VNSRVFSDLGKRGGRVVVEGCIVFTSPRFGERVSVRIPDDRRGAARWVDLIPDLIRDLIRT